MDNDLKGIICLLVLLGMLFAGATGVVWYSAGIQQQVYQRQGFTMTQWEVFCGAQPVHVLKGTGE